MLNFWLSGPALATRLRGRDRPTARTAPFPYPEWKATGMSNSIITNGAALTALENPERDLVAADHDAEPHLDTG